MNTYIYIIIAVIFTAVGSAGTIAITKATKPVVKLNCPACPECPPQTAIDLGALEFDKINNKKGNFNIHQTFSNVQIKIEAKDSLLLKRALRSK